MISLDAPRTGELRKLGRRLLSSGEADVIIGHQAASLGSVTQPLFARTSDDCDKLVWCSTCVGNLTAHLTRPEIKDFGKPAIVVKGCEVAAITVLVRENQLERSGITVIGVSCEGMLKPEPGAAAATQLGKCSGCAVRTPSGCDYQVGSDVGPDTAERCLALDDSLESMSADDRWGFWQSELEHCFKCYACRAVCPLCYCNRCFVDKTRPAWTSSSQAANAVLHYHIFRAFHLAGRCITCGECERVCPQDIPLGLLNRKMQRTVEELYGSDWYDDPRAPAPLLGFNPDETFEFFR